MSATTQPAKKKRRVAKPKRGTKTKTELKHKSPAEFFSTNKNIAGFDNPGKSLYTTVRELVENGLDAAEMARVPPEISVEIEEMTQAQLNKTLNVTGTERQNAALYTKNNDDDGGKDKDKSAGKRMYYRVRVIDNGTGMPHDELPMMLGCVLAGTKYGVQQSRGKFGLGSKMAVIWARMSTGVPIEIRTAQQGSNQETFCRMSIDIYKNVPEVQDHRRLPNSDPKGWHGTDITVVIEGSFTRYRAMLLRYMRQLAVITPHADMRVKFVPHAGPQNARAFEEHWTRSTDELPPPPQTTQYHPSAVDLLVLRHLGDEYGKKPLRTFLHKAFQRISLPLADKFCAELGLDGKARTATLTRADWTRVHQLFQQAKFMRPSADVLSPAGEEALRAGIERTVGPELLATHRGAPGVFEGHPFLVEAAVSIGGADAAPGVTVHRFANRIPLLLEAAGDVSTKAAAKIPWVNYKINHKTDRVGVYVSIVSTKIPFKGTGKEYIGADIDEVARAVYKTIRACARKLQGEMSRRARTKAAADRERAMMRYGTQAATLHARLVEQILERPSNPQRPSAVDEWLRPAAERGECTADVFTKHLQRHVAAVDVDVDTNAE